MAAANIPTAMQALCNPAEPLATMALQLDSPNGRGIIDESAFPISLELTTVSTMNSSECKKDRKKAKIEN